MSDPVDHALLSLKKTRVPRPHFFTIRHEGSGAEKRVQYLGLAGIPLRAQIFWPIAGDYFVSPRTGTIIGTAQNAERLRPWRLAPQDLAFLRVEYRKARARALLSETQPKLRKTSPR